MTFKALLNFGSSQKATDRPVERFHSGWPAPSHHHGSYSAYKGQKGGSGAALSALTLLAFLFLLNVMQQSLQDTNSTVTTSTTALFLRDEDRPMIIDAREEKEREKVEESPSKSPNNAYARSSMKTDEDKVL